MLTNARILTEEAELARSLPCLPVPRPIAPINPETGFRVSGSYRRTVHRSDAFLIEDSSVSAEGPGPSGYETKYQVVLPYLGLFEYNVGRRACHVDSACTLFVSPDREYFDVHPLPNVGHSGIVINVRPDLIEEMLRDQEAETAFFDMVRPATPRLKLFTQHMLRAAEFGGDPLYADECTIAALSEALGTRPKGKPRNSRVVQNAKMVLHARESERVSLSEVAAEVGVSGIYLTQEFSRVEGIPLYQYQLQLRMNRSLVELPHCESITGLALDLGFSSHSHFTSAFRRHFGITPSDYRLGKCIDPASFRGTWQSGRTLLRRAS